MSNAGTAIIAVFAVAAAPLGHAPLPTSEDDAVLRSGGAT